MTTNRQRRTAMATAAVATAPRKPVPALERTTFKTSRLAEFCSRRELVAQTGHQVHDWPLVILKELTDNAIDICEEKRRISGDDSGLPCTWGAARRRGIVVRVAFRR
jgi:hypothetical protein